MMKNYFIHNYTRDMRMQPDLVVLFGYISLNAYTPTHERATESCLPGTYTVFSSLGKYIIKRQQKACHKIK